MKALFDTSVLADYLRGLEPARMEFERHEVRCVSVLSWTEIMANARDEAEAQTIGSFFEGFQVIDVSSQIARRAALLARAHGLRMPDAIVLATAQSESAMLITRAADVFPAGSPGIRVPY